jgi:hypothetical protein
LPAAPRWPRSDRSRWSRNDRSRWSRSDPSTTVFLKALREGLTHQQPWTALGRARSATPGQQRTTLVSSAQLSEGVDRWPQVNKGPASSLRQRLRGLTMQASGWGCARPSVYTSSPVLLLIVARVLWTARPPARPVWGAEATMAEPAGPMTFRCPAGGPLHLPTRPLHSSDDLLGLLGAPAFRGCLSLQRHTR